MSDDNVLCPACADEEIARASNCYAKCEAAKARGEESKCECPPLNCEHELFEPGEANNTA